MVEKFEIIISFLSFHKPDQSFGWHLTEAFPLGLNTKQMDHLCDDKNNK